jgi:hypothetical protein
MRDAEANGQACRRGTGKAASLTTKTKPAPDGALRYENEKPGLAPGWRKRQVPPK